MIPIIGFGTRFYEGVNFVSRNDTLENDYGRKKLFLTFIIIFIVFGIIFIFWNNIVETKSKAKKLTNYYFVFANSRLINKTKQLISENYLECDDYDYKDNSGVYYIYIADIGSHTYLPFYYLRDDISASVLVDNTSGESKIYVSLTDGTFGFRETLAEEVGPDSLEEYKNVEYISREMNTCKFVE
jgi:hypothetical protein